MTNTRNREREKKKEKDTKNRDYFDELTDEMII